MVCPPDLSEDLLGLMLGRMMIERMLFGRDRKATPLFDAEKARQVGCDLYEVVTHLQTSRVEKDRGALLKYEDDRLSMSYDTWGRKYVVLVGVSGDWEQVYAVSCGDVARPCVFRPGNWVEYIHEVLLPRAEECKRLADAQERLKEVEKNRRNYREVDDGDLFADVEGMSV